ncbi:uncharacterized protein GGS25DRAFT_520621 [Hypoxylon fragiforme]|uniref:uncharacterized protein n=1 Tax=Hypoxylon fragiforme TaxID=63214 RepID=UPI0020C6B0DB|nr:uncharacterized protein GGS25DRAFT_520621 [Hypoxylon fragiforme]KAI2609816.1 hypothetical protein GGS25DRAFT_520621 [Hypoxylon fragiforme]
MSNYPYAPPPPAPSAASPSPYPPYSQGPGYAHPPPRGGHAAAAGGGRSHGHHQGPARTEYGSPYYQHQDYNSPSGGHYSSSQPPTAYWQGAPPVSHGHPSSSSLPTSYAPPNYAPQTFNAQPAQPYPPPYPSPASRPPYGAAYGQAPSEYAQPPQQWGEQSQAYPPYSSRGGRGGGYPSDRGGPLRNPYPPAHHQPAPLQQPPYGYPPSTAPSYPGLPQTHYGSNSKGHGRGGYPHSNRGAHAINNDRGEKFRHRDQKPHQSLNHQKSDPAAAKKKKRKTNTLGLTPGEDDSDDGVDEEKRLEELLGADVPGIPDGDLAKWIAARKANYPTKARVAQKKEAALVSKPVAEVQDSKETVTVEVDPVEKEADRLRKRLAKLDRKIEKRKRAPNDEGDEMRSESSDDESDDEKPESLPTDKSATGFLPPPPITRADPSNHCKYYSTGGICGKKGKCRFVHDPAVREAALQERTMNGGRMTLKQRLLLNDKDQEDKEVIKTIVELRSSGRLHDPQNPQVHADREAQEKAAAVASVSSVSSLPTTGGEANLPPNPYAHLKNADAAARYRKPKKFNDWAPVKHPAWNPPS